MSLYTDYPAPIAGDPALVSARSASFLSTADAILTAAADLASIADVQRTVGKSIDAVRSMAEQVREEIVLAEARYRETALALQEFAPALAGAQAHADGAATSYAARVRSAQSAYESFHYGNNDDAEREVAREKWRMADASVLEAREQYELAVVELRTASDAAAQRVRAVVDHSDLNDSFWDNLSGFGEAVGAWFVDVFGPEISQLLNDLGKLLDVAMYLVTVVLALVLGLFIAIDLWLYFEFGNEAALDEEIALITIVVSPLLLSTWVTGHGEPELVSSRHTTRAPKEDPFSALWVDQADIDEMGAEGDFGADSAVVQVTTVVGEDGVTRYRVQVPSTQQWFSFGGDAPNDLSGNLWGKFFPDDRAQLDKAVEAALLEAGYIAGSGSEILLSGFSQGGIAAANLTTFPEFTERFNVTMVVTAGSPIGDVPIPPVADGGPVVVSLEHAASGPGQMGDPVPELDFFTPNPQRDGWANIRTPTVTPDAAHFGHSADEYGLTATQQLDESTDPERVALRELAAPFFESEETVGYYEFKRS